MTNPNKPPHDYLCIGHLTQDKIGDDWVLGGTAAFSALTAKEFGYKAKIISAGNYKHHEELLDEVELQLLSNKGATRFINKDTDNGRKQSLQERAPSMPAMQIASSLQEYDGILHLGPVADEVDQNIINLFPRAFIGLTPQGWMRQWDEKGFISHKKWLPDPDFCRRIEAIVFSMEDVINDEDLVIHYSKLFHIMAVTDGNNGARIFVNGNPAQIYAPDIKIVDSTGAGDIFAAVFFIGLFEGMEPIEAGQLAVFLASRSVTRKRFESIPTKKEIQTTIKSIQKG